MKVWLDDKCDVIGSDRETPEGWVGVKTAHEAITLLDAGKVTEISLDHDLSEQPKDNGNQVLLHIEKRVVEEGFSPPIIHVHTANLSARQKMELGVKSIERLAAKNKESKGDIEGPLDR
jgi:hypothetical protein